jgi:hypothetical protein
MKKGNHILLLIITVFTFVVSGCADSGGSKPVTLTADTSSTQAQIDTLNNMITGLGISELRSQVLALTAQNPLLQAALDKQIQDAAAQFAANNATITAIQASLASLSAQLNAIVANSVTPAQIAALGIDQLKAQVDALVANSPILQATLDKQIADTAAQFAATNNTIGGIQAALTALGNGLNTTIATLSTQVTNQGNSIATLQQSITSIQTTISNNVATAATKSDIASLQAQITAAAATSIANLQALQTQVNTLQTNLNTVASSTTTNSNNISTMQATITTLQNQIATLQSQVAGSTSGGLIKVTTTKAGAGSGSISPVSPQYWPKATAGLAFTATPSAGSYFGGWTSTCSGNPNATTYTLTGNQSDCTVTATFTTVATYYVDFSFGTAAWGNDAQDQAGVFTRGPYFMTTDASDNLITIDYAGRVQTFSSNGTFISKFATNTSPSGFFVDATGTIYVLNAATPSVNKYSSSGTLLSSFNVTANAGGGVMVDASGNVYVVNINTFKLFKYTSSGVLVSSVNLYSTVPVLIGSPFFNIAIDSSNNIYVSCNDQALPIKKFNSNLAYVADIGVVGSNNGQYKSPFALAIKNNHLFVADESITNVVGRVQEFDLNGTVLSAQPYVFSPNGVNGSNSNLLAVDSLDNFYVYTYAGPTAFISKIRH